MKTLRITCQPKDLDQGLFGNVFYHLFQVLPYLYERNLYPAWEIRSLHYGDPPYFITVPGALDLSYPSPTGPYENISLPELRRRHTQVLGNDWRTLSKIWKAYFAIPKRVVEQADQMNLKGRLLGVHYRGTDKQINTWDSNPISQTEFIALLSDFLDQHTGYEHIVVATDEHSFVHRLASSISIPVISLGEVEFHLAAEHSTSRAQKSDRAMVDCLLLSRCACVIQTSSALPSFAKVFNPELEIYRCAASKRFNAMPYFPVAYIPVLPVTRPESVEILTKTMKDDWVVDATMNRYFREFLCEPRWPINHNVFRMLDRFGLSSPLAKFLTGYR